nr:uncharacterized protein LOC122606142 isoform X2 [Erigeron canadensis]
MNPYNRLLVHRLADIFGFSHHSIGEGDERHLVLKRCEDTSVPSILVADMLWEHVDYQSPITSQILSRREDVSAGTKIETLSAQLSLKDREEAYMAARKRIFSTDDDMELPAKERPRNNPVVARRMIAHALGQKIKQSNLDIGVTDAMVCQEPANEAKGQNISSSLKTHAKSNSQQHISGNEANKTYSNKKMLPNLGVEASSTANAPKCNLKEEHIVAAKRMFANALRMHPGKEIVLSKCGQTKQMDKS